MDSNDDDDDNEDDVDDSKLEKKSLLLVSQENTEPESTTQISPIKHQNDAVEKSHIRSLQSLVHDSIQTSSYSESLTIHEARTHESAVDIPQNFVKTKSLMDLLTSKPSESSTEVKVGMGRDQ